MGAESRNSSRSITLTIARDWMAYLGILGAAISILGGVEPFLRVAGWARIFLQQWHGWIIDFWTMLAQLIGIKLNAYFVYPLTLAAFLLFTAIGVRIRGAGAGKNVYPKHEAFSDVAYIFLLALMALGSWKRASSVDDPPGLIWGIVIAIASWFYFDLATYISRNAEAMNQRFIQIALLVCFLGALGLISELAEVATKSIGFRPF